MGAPLMDRIAELERENKGLRGSCDVAAWKTKVAVVAAERDELLGKVEAYKKAVDLYDEAELQALKLATTSAEVELEEGRQAKAERDALREACAGHVHGNKQGYMENDCVICKALEGGE